MNGSIKSALKNPQFSSFHLRSMFFHSTATLQRARRNSSTAVTPRSNNNSNNNYRRSGHGLNYFKKNLMKNVKACVDYLFKSWQSNSDQDDQSSNKGPSRLRKPHNRSGRNSSYIQGRQKKERGCSNYEDNLGDLFIFWWFMDSSRSSKSDKTSQKCRHWIEDDDDDDADDDDDFF